MPDCSVVVSMVSQTLSRMYHSLRTRASVIVLALPQVGGQPPYRLRPNPSEAAAGAYFIRAENDANEMTLIAVYLRYERARIGAGDFPGCSYITGGFPEDDRDLLNLYATLSDPENNEYDDRLPYPNECDVDSACVVRRMQQQKH